MYLQQGPVEARSDSDKKKTSSAWKPRASTVSPLSLCGRKIYRCESEKVETESWALPCFSNSALAWGALTWPEYLAWGTLTWPGVYCPGVPCPGLGYPTKRTEGTVTIMIAPIKKQPPKETKSGKTVYTCHIIIWVMGTGAALATR